MLVSTPFIVGYNIEVAKLLHLLKFLILMPIRYKFFVSRGWQYYMCEFCYYASVLFNLFLVQEKFLGGIWNNYFLSIYTVATGPLLVAIMLNRDKLFIHSHSHLTTAYIHLTPALLAWGMRWHNVGQDYQQMYPPDFSVSSILRTYWAVLVQFKWLYLFWLASYYASFFIIWWTYLKEGNFRTVFFDFANNDKLWISRRVASLSPMLKGAVYILGHVINFIVTSLFGVICFHNFWINTVAIIMGFLITNWFASYKVIKALNVYDEVRYQQKTESKTQTKTESKDPPIEVSDDFTQTNIQPVTHVSEEEKEYLENDVKPKKD